MALFTPPLESGLRADSPRSAADPLNADIPEKLCNLPPLNAIANQVLAAVADGDIEFSRIAEMIKSDPAFAADILLLANSPVFGCRTRLSDLNRAIAQLGIARVRALAVAIAMRAFCTNAIRVSASWRHSVATAVVSEQFAPMFGLLSAEAYTAGLIHDIGRLGLMKSYPKEADAVFFSEYLNPSELLAVERTALRLEHTQAGAWLARAWRLPDFIQEICQKHHEPAHQSDSPRLQLVKSACLITDSLGFSAVAYRKPPEYADLIRTVLPGIHRGRVPLEDDLRNDVESRLQTLVGD